MKSRKLKFRNDVRNNLSFGRIMWSRINCSHRRSIEAATRDCNSVLGRICPIIVSQSTNCLPRTIFRLLHLSFRASTETSPISCECLHSSSDQSVCRDRSSRTISGNNNSELAAIGLLCPPMWDNLVRSLRILFPRARVSLCEQVGQWRRDVKSVTVYKPFPRDTIARLALIFSTKRSPLMSSYVEVFSKDNIVFALRKSLVE